MLTPVHRLHCRMFEGDNRMTSARSTFVVAGFIACAAVAGTAHAVPFQSVIDEFWIVKNGGEIFRDSFSDGLLPTTGPDGASTYSVAGSAGMTSESGGKLTMTPSLGTGSVITNGFAQRL